MTLWTPPQAAVAGETALAAAERKAREAAERLKEELPGFQFVLFVTTPDQKYVTNVSSFKHVQAMLSMLLGQINNYILGAVAPAGALDKGSTH